MNTFKILLFLSLFAVAFVSCDDEDEEGELTMGFKTGDGYISADTTLQSGLPVVIGVEAETSKPSDPIIKFNISESVNGGTNTTVYSEDIETAVYEYDYEFIFSDTTTGNKHKYTFTATNRDGILVQKSITLTVE